MEPAPLLERDHELQAIDALLSGGRALVLTGEAGIGKTALLAAAAEHARARGLTVLSATGGALETGFAFGVARQLLEAAATPERLTGAAAAAAPALGLRPGRAGPGVRFELQHGLYWLTANLAERAPLLIAVDDVQWADRDSLHWLLYLARRLEELPVALLLALRIGEPEDEALSALRAEASELTPAALSVEATAAVIAAALGPPAPRFAAACREASGGNPFLLRALVDELAADGVTPAATETARVHAADPVAVQRAVLLRLGRLGPAAVGFAQAVAILDRDAELGLAAALAQLATPEADPLIAARVLEAAHPLRFAHPMLRAAVYGDMGLARRAALHRRAAELLDPRAPDRAALHLLNTHPGADPWVLGRLRAAAERALGSGSPASAIALLERALAEAPSGETRAGALLALGAAERRAGTITAAEHLEEALRHTGEPALRGRIVRELAPLRWASGDLDALFAATIAEADPELRLELEADRAAFAGVNAPHRLGPVPEDLRGDTPAERRLLATLAFQRTLSGVGTGAAAAALAERALAGGRLLAEVGGDHPAVLSVVSTLQATDRVDAADALVAGALAAGQGTGTVEIALLRAMSGRLAYVRGDLRSAEASLREAAAVARVAGLGLAARFTGAYVALALVERGELGQADADLGDLPPPGDGTRWIFLQARAALRRAQHRFAEALADAELAESERPESVLGPAMLAVARHAAGESDRARAPAAAAVAHARRWAVPSTLGMALRIQGLIEGDLDRLREAVAVLAPSPRRLEHARALVDFGAGLRRANRRADAREPLAAGMELADRCGASALAVRARAELVTCGARPRRPHRSGVDALTPSELRVAQLAASGLTNREIAQALFVTRKTVETHLAGVYRKLGVNERGGLPAKLREGDPDAKPGGVAEALVP